LKTLLIGDTHLMCRLILPMVKRVIQVKAVERVILMGDYTDQWGAIGYPEMYKDDLRFLYRWKSEMIANEVEVILLAGNHDIPYLIDKQVYYSVVDVFAFEWIKEMLYDLELQVAYRLGDYLVSHAGYTKDYEPMKWHFETLTSDHVEKLISLHEHVGMSRGGRFITGSPVWADLNWDLKEFYHHDFPKQIVGHTPVETIDLMSYRLGIDTFSLTKNYQPFGDGGMLLYKNGNLSVVENYEWRSDVVCKYFDDNLGWKLKEF